MERIFVAGDGAAWIRAGARILPKATFVLDKFHLKKAITAAVGTNWGWQSGIWAGIRRGEREAIDAVLKEALGEAALGLPEIRGGLAPVMALTGAVRLLAREGVMELALLGESITARRAQEIGLVNWVCPQAQVLDRALSAAGRLAAQNPTAMALCKRTTLVHREPER